MKHRYHLIVLIVFCTLSIEAFASSDGASNYIKNVSDQTLTVLNDTQLTNDEKKNGIIHVFDEAVDAHWIARFSIGKNWRRLSEQDRAKFTELNYLAVLYKYLSRVIKFEGQTIHHLHTRNIGDDEYEVHTEIRDPQKPADAPAIDVSYKVRYYAGSPSPYKVYDVVLEKLSLLQAQRAEYYSILSRNSINKLLFRLYSRASPIRKYVEGNESLKTYQSLSIKE